MKCKVFHGRIGYRGQKYAVVFTNEDGERKMFGWQNEETGGLADAAALRPGWTNIQVLPVINDKGEVE